MSPERMNRWLLIGAAAFAVLAGALVFALLANVGSDDGGGGGGAAAAGDRVSVLVATETISPGTIVTADMLELASFEQRYIVPDKVDDVSSIIGSRAAVRVLQGQQISRLQFIGEGGTDVPGITPEIPPGHFAYAVSITEVSGVAGLIVPGDRVDIVVRYSTPGSNAATKIMHIEPFATNVLVLARGQEDVDGPAVVGDGTGDAGAGVRPEDVDPDPGAATLTLALRPDQVLGINTFEVLEDGEISFALRRFGDEETAMPAEGIAFEVPNR
jgi:pilus assembly protein CpaB